MPNNSTYMPFWKRQNNRDRSHISDCQWLKGKVRFDCRKAAWGIWGMRELLYLDCDGYTTPRTGRNSELYISRGGFYCMTTEI